MNTKIKLALYGAAMFLLCTALAVSMHESRELRKEYRQTLIECADLYSTNQRLSTEVDELAFAKVSLEDYASKLSKSLLSYTDQIDYSAAPAPIYDIPLAAEYQQYTYDTCKVYGIEEHYDIVLALMWQESRYDFSAISPTNDYGIMQINIRNHDKLRDILGFEDIMDPYNNIECGIYILSMYILEYGDAGGLMCYNMGPDGAKAQWARGNYTTPYTDSIIRKAAELTKIE